MKYKESTKGKRMRTLFIKLTWFMNSGQVVCVRNVK